MSARTPRERAEVIAALALALDLPALAPWQVDYIEQVLSAGDREQLEAHEREQARVRAQASEQVQTWRAMLNLAPGSLLERRLLEQAVVAPRLAHQPEYCALGPAHCVACRGVLVRRQATTDFLGRPISRRPAGQ